MEEKAVRAEGIRAMTLITKPDLSDKCSSSLIRVNECSDERDGAVREQDTERNAESCGHQRTEVCELPPVNTDTPNNSDPGEDQPPAPAPNNDLIQQDGSDIRSESRQTDHRLEAEETPDSNAASESFQTTLTGQQKSESSQLSAQQCVWSDHDDEEEILRRAQEEGCVRVVFPGSVTQDSCCRFVCELLKCVLYQRQQLPMTYDQMVFFQKQQYSSTQPEEAAVKKSLKTTGDLSWKHCQRTLQELDEVLGHMEALFSLSYVPRVLFMLGGSTVLPTELYEINMESLKLRGGDRSLRTSSCLRRLFRTLFVADLLSDVRPVRLMATTVMAFGHRDCGVEWFKPKVNFRVPTKVKRRVIALASDASSGSSETAQPKDWTDYIWFQAPVTIKGFCK